jgi:hypothetical protein
MTSRVNRGLALLGLLVSVRVGVDPAVRTAIVNALVSSAHEERRETEALLHDAPGALGQLSFISAVVRARSSDYLRVDRDQRAADALALLISDDAENTRLTVRSIFPAASAVDSGVVAATIDAEGTTEAVAGWLARLDTAIPRRRVRRLRLSFAGASDDGLVTVSATIEALLPATTHASTGGRR